MAKYKLTNAGIVQVFTQNPKNDDNNIKKATDNKMLGKLNLVLQQYSQLDSKVAAKNSPFLTVNDISGGVDSVNVGSPVKEGVDYMAEEEEDVIDADAGVEDYNDDAEEIDGDTDADGDYDGDEEDNLDLSEFDGAIEGLADETISVLLTIKESMSLSDEDDEKLIHSLLDALYDKIIEDDEGALDGEDEDETSDGDAEETEAPEDEGEGE